MPAQRDYKKGMNKDDCRKNRAQQQVQLRKASKEEGMQKRRNMALPADAEIVVEDTTVAGQGAETSVPNLSQLVMHFVQAGGPQEQFAACLEAVVQLRKLLSIAHKPPIDEVIETGVVPSLVMLLGYPEHKMQFEAAWCVTNIGSGTSEQCQVVVSHNCVPALVGLISSPNLEVAEQAVWALGNIAGDCTRLRDHVLESGVLEPLFAFIEMTATQQKMVPLRNAVWSLSNLVRGKNPPWDKVACTVPLLTRLLSIDDSEVHQDTCWALSYLADGENKRIDAIALAGACPTLVRLLGSGEMRVVTPAMRALSNMLTGSDGATQAVLEAGFLRELPPLFRSSKMQLRKEVCWAISNVTAGTAAQLDEVMRTDLLKLVVERLDKDEFDVQKEAAWVCANVMHGHKNEKTLHAANRVRTLVQLGCIPPMVRLLEKNEPSTQSLMLEAFANLLAAGEELGKGGENEFVKAFDEAEGIDTLEKLQEHQNEAIYEKAVHILETYFGEEEDEDENLAPNTTAGGGFAFGQPALAPSGFAF